MTKYYPVVKVQRSWYLSAEEMGSREKFWYQDPISARWWLFKSPRKGTGEHWAEKIASGLAEVLSIDHATTELAVFRNECGSVSESFVHTSQELVHGNQLLGRGVEGYDAKQKFKHTNHTLDNIWGVMESVFEHTECTRQAKARIGEYLVLDALVGNTDRHHENWGLLRTKLNNHFQEFVAPSYDHASSLGRELLDARRVRLLADGSVGRYVEKGRGGVYWTRNDSGALSPLELVRRTATGYPKVVQPVLDRVKSIDNASVVNLVERIPPDWMSRPARDFAITMICYARDELGRLL